MKISGDMEKRSENLRHKKELQNLKRQHEREIDNINTTHAMKKNQIRTAQTLEKNSLHNEHQIELAKQIGKNEKVYDQLKQSLDEVKTRTKSEKEKIEKQYEGQLAQMKTNFESLAHEKKEKSNFRLQDIDHEANIEIGKIQRKVNQAKKEESAKGQEQLAHLKSGHEKKYQERKSLFTKKQMAQEDKFQNALIKQAKMNNDQLVREERQHQRKVQVRNKVFNQQINKLTSDHTKRQIGLQKYHEKTYQNNYKKNESQLQSLLGKKEKLVSRVRNLLKTEAKKEMELNKDPFYHAQNLEKELSFNPKKNEYTLKVKIPKHEASKIQLVGFERQLKITLDRNFENLKTDESGTTHKINKAETIVEKIPVDYILDPKSITSKYQDNQIIYTIGLA